MLKNKQCMSIYIRLEKHFVLGYNKGSGWQSVKEPGTDQK